MKTNLVVSFIALAAIALVFGCGGSPSAGAGPAKLVAPKTPGDPAALIGTTWVDPATNASLKFTDATKVEVSNPKTPKPMAGVYSVKDGIITVNVPLQILSGTWDGADLIINGLKLTKQ